MSTIPDSAKLVVDDADVAKDITWGELKALLIAQPNVLAALVAAAPTQEQKEALGAALGLWVSAADGSYSGNVVSPDLAGTVLADGAIGLVGGVVHRGDGVLTNGIQVEPRRWASIKFSAPSGATDLVMTVPVPADRNVELGGFILQYDLQTDAQNKGCFLWAIRSAADPVGTGTKRYFDGGVQPSTNSARHWRGKLPIAQSGGTVAAGAGLGFPNFGILDAFDGTTLTRTRTLHPTATQTVAAGQDLELDLFFFEDTSSGTVFASAELTMLEI